MIGMFTQMEALYNKLENLILKVDSPLYLEYLKQYGIFSKVVQKCRKWQKVQLQITELEEMIAAENDGELCLLIGQELEQLKRQDQEMWLEMVAATNKESNYNNAIVEIRSGAGGEEASLFTQDLFTMYSKFAEKNRLSLELLNLSKTNRGGVKDVAFCVRGKQAYKFWKFEGGGHRVQRVPKTESGGRIHTSMCNVVVLPEIKDVELNICEKDLKIEAMRASGAGGQHVNKTSSAIRITHIPSQITATCQATRSQHQNKEKALQVLRARVYEFQKKEQQQQQNSMRDDQKTSGERNERIRTYNFPQNRVTDHRIDHSIYDLQNILYGNFLGFNHLLQQREIQLYLADLISQNTDLLN